MRLDFLSLTAVLAPFGERYSRGVESYTPSEKGCKLSPLHPSCIIAL